MRFRKLRIAWSVLCAILWLLLIALWVRSYKSEDYLQGHLVSVHNLIFTSIEGRVNLTAVDIKPGRLPWETGGKALGDWPAHRIPLWPHGSQFGLKRERDHFDVVAPHWFFALLLTISVAAPWIRLSRRFTLRTLVIVTTLVAVVLGLMAWSMK